MDLQINSALNTIFKVHHIDQLDVLKFQDKYVVRIKDSFNADSWETLDSYLEIIPGLRIVERILNVYFDVIPTPTTAYSLMMQERGNNTKVASMLNVTRSTLRKNMKLGTNPYIVFGSDVYKYIGKRNY